MFIIALCHRHNVVLFRLISFNFTAVFFLKVKFEIVANQETEIVYQKSTSF